MCFPQSSAVRYHQWVRKASDQGWSKRWQNNMAGRRRSKVYLLLSPESMTAVLKLNHDAWTQKKKGLSSRSQDSTSRTCHQDEWEPSLTMTGGINKTWDWLFEFILTFTNFWPNIQSPMKRHVSVGNHIPDLPQKGTFFKVPLRFSFDLLWKSSYAVFSQDQYIQKHSFWRAVGVH